jgi:hypothetical protein
LRAGSGTVERATLRRLGYRQRLGGRLELAFPLLEERTKVAEFLCGERIMLRPHQRRRLGTDPISVFLKPRTLAEAAVNGPPTNIARAEPPP